MNELKARHKILELLEKESKKRTTSPFTTEIALSDEEISGILKLETTLVSNQTELLDQYGEIDAIGSGVDIQYFITRNGTSAALEKKYLNQQSEINFEKFKRGLTYISLPLAIAVSILSIINKSQGNKNANEIEILEKKIDSINKAQTYEMINPRIIKSKVEDSQKSTNIQK